LLFLHGYKSQKESFIRQIGFFSKFYRVVAVDMRGFGKADQMPYPYALDDYANEIKNLLDLLGEQKVDVVAHSFGARVLVKLLSKGETRIDKIIFTGAAGLKPRRRLSHLLKRASFLLLKIFIPREKLTFLYSKDYQNLSEVERQSFKLVVNEHLDKEYKKINNRCLIIFGDKDRETPPCTAKKMNKYIKNSKLKFISNTGHFCFCQKPEEFNGAVFSFLLGG